MSKSTRIIGGIFLLALIAALAGCETLGIKKLNWGQTKKALKSYEVPY